MQTGNISASNIHKVSFFDYLATSLAESMWLVANRENRRRDRYRSREAKASYHHKVGLNGPRAVARRLRQIKTGQLSPLYVVGADGKLSDVPVHCWWHRRRMAA